MKVVSRFRPRFIRGQQHDVIHSQHSLSFYSRPTELLTLSFLLLFLSVIKARRSAHEETNPHNTTVLHYLHYLAEYRALFILHTHAYTQN